MTVSHKRQPSVMMNINDGPWHLSWVHDAERLGRRQKRTFYKFLCTNYATICIMYTNFVV